MARCQQAGRREDTSVGVWGVRGWGWRTALCPIFKQNVKQLARLVR